MLGILYRQRIRTDNASGILVVVNNSVINVFLSRFKHDNCSLLVTSNDAYIDSISGAMAYHSRMYYAPFRLVASVLRNTRRG